MARKARQDFIFVDCADYEVVADRDVDYEGWISKRQETVGASDKCDRASFNRRTGDAKKFTGNRHTFFGQWLEEPALLAFGEWSGLKVASSSTLLHSKNYPHMSATPDGIGAIKHPGKFRDYLQYELSWDTESIRLLMEYDNEFLLEVKTPGWNKLPEWCQVSWKASRYTVADTGETWYHPVYGLPKADPPKDYYCQCQHQMAVTGHRLCLLLGVVGGKQFIIFPIYYDQEFVERRVEQCEEFLEMVRRNEWNPKRKKR